jgi:hypothetical protein
MTQSGTEKTQKTQKYICEICDFKTDNNADYVRHTMTRKHKTGTTMGQMKLKNANMCSICKNSYNSRSSFYRHKKKCKEEDIKEEVEEEPTSNMDLIMEVLKQNQTIMSENQEIKGLIIEKPSAENNESLIIELLHLFSFKTRIILIKRSMNVNQPAC